MAVASPNPRLRAGDEPPAGAAPAGAARALLVVLGACLVLAAFASGATQLPEETWLQVALAATATAAVAGWLYGPLRLRASPAGWAGLVLLVAFAAWTGASIAWSVAPDRSWVELNRALSYAAVAGCGLVLGSSLPRAPERVGRMLALVSVPVALYALGGKTLPGLHVGGLLDLDHAGGYNRLKAPLEYWNALALLCVIGLLPMLRLAADPWRRARERVLALLGVYLLALVLGLTYSRGGLLALVAGLAVLVALGTERVRTVALFSAALGATVLPLGVALSRDDLTTDLVPLAQREDDALLVLVAALGSAALLAGLGRALIAAEERVPVRAVRRRGRQVATGLGAVLVVVVLAATVAGRTGEVFEDFRATDDPAEQTDPNRLLSANSGNRWVWWSEAAGAWSDKPVAGWGAGSFPVTHLLYREEPLSVQQPHSVPLQWLAETGLVGLLLAGGAVLALLAAAVARTRALRWAARGGPPERGAAAALVAVGAAWTVHALYDWDWDVPAVTAPALLALAVLAARPSPTGGRPPRGRAAGLVAAAVLAVLVVVSAALPALSQDRARAAVEAVGGTSVSEQRLVQAAVRADIAVRLNPLAVEPLFAAASVAERRGRYEEARRYLLRAAERQPDSVDAWTRLVRFSFARQDPVTLRRAALEALALDPIGRRTLDLARRAVGGFASPAQSATATGTPLAEPAPAPAATATPAAAATPPSPSVTPTPAAAGTPAPPVPTIDPEDLGGARAPGVTIP